MKRNYIKLFLVAVLALCSASAAFSQKPELTSDEIVVLTGKAERKLDNISYKTLLTTEWFTQRDGDLINRDTYFFATIQPERYHWLLENADNKIETIVVDGRTWRRVKDADWESVATSPVKKANNSRTQVRFGELAGGAFSPSGKGRYVNRGTIDGQVVSMYEVSTTSTDGKPDGITKIDTTQFWINKSGFLVRKVIEQDIIGERRFMRSVANYEYTDVRIEEPTVPTKTEDK